MPITRALNRKKVLLFYFTAWYSLIGYHPWKGVIFIFNSPSQTNLIELNGEYSFPIMVLSIAIACIASFTAMSMNARAQKNSFFHQKFWLILASIAMGFGIWSMHFVGMSAFLLPINMHYDYILTIFSVIPAMVASFLAFYIANKPKKVFWSYSLAGIVMGLGISTMHYVGMAAMKMDAVVVYDIWLFIISIVIAIIVSFAALYIFSAVQRYMDSRFIQLITAIIMGLAVSSMHFTGMSAISFYVTPEQLSNPISIHSMNTPFIVISVSIGMGILLSLLLLSSIIDGYVKYRINYYDSLTRLPNRRQFEKKLEGSLSPQTIAVWHLHNLEKVNRENGYLFGDEVIQRLASLLLSLKPPMTDLYRIEGNRFAFITKAPEDITKFQRTMNKVAQKLSEPFVFQNKEIILPAVCAWLPASDGISGAKSYSNVLSVLNYPLLQYKHEVILYDSKIHTYTFEREITNDISRAIEENELYLVYQPKVNGKTNEIVGVETLIRWQHRTYGMLSPGVFIPLLEEKNQMLDVTDWIIEQVCKQISVWKEEGVSFGQVAINISGQYVTSSRLLKVLKRTITKYNLDPQLLELEITETSFVKKIEEAMQAVSVLRKEGFSVALDDFGTGVSSLSYLKQIPISTLKIDKSFIDEVPNSKKDSSIIQAIIALGSSLDLNIVFEGVETEEQVQFLTSTCEEPIIQGYYYAKPMKAEELLDWFDRYKAINL